MRSESYLFIWQPYVTIASFLVGILVTPWSVSVREHALLTQKGQLLFEHIFHCGPTQIESGDTGRRQSHPPELRRGQARPPHRAVAQVSAHEQDAFQIGVAEVSPTQVSALQVGIGQIRPA